MMHCIGESPLSNLLNLADNLTRAKGIMTSPSDEILGATHLRAVEHDLSRPILHPLRPVDDEVVVHSEHHLLPHASAHHIAHLFAQNGVRVQLVAPPVCPSGNISCLEGFQCDRGWWHLGESTWRAEKE